LVRAFIASLLAALLVGCNQPAGSPEPAAAPAPAVSVAEVVVKEVAQWDEFTGHIETVDTVEIRPRVAGYISSGSVSRKEKRSRRARCCSS
jgi:multidrug efflux system membrane fusion protein